MFKKAVPAQRVVLWVFVLAAVLAVLTASTVVHDSLVGEARERWAEHMGAMSVQVARSCDRRISDARRDLEYLASLPEFSQLSAIGDIDLALNGLPEHVDPDKRALLEMLRLKDGRFSVLFVLTPEARHYISHPFEVQRSLTKYDLSDREYIKEAVRTGQPVVSDSFVGADGELAVAVDVPVFAPDGGLVAHLGGVFHLDRLSEHVAGEELGQASMAFLVDGSGDLIGHSDPSRLATGSRERFLVSGGADSAVLQGDSQDTGPRVEDWIDPQSRKAYLTAFTTLQTGWTLGLGHETAAIEAACQAETLRATSVAALLALVVCGLGFLVARSAVIRWEAAESELAKHRENLEELVGLRTAALTKSEEHLRALTENSEDYILRYDSRLAHVYVNQAAARSARRSKEEMIGKTHAELGYPAELCTMFEAAIRRVFETGRAHAEVFEWPNTDPPMWLDWRLVPEHDAGGAVATVLGVARDISKEKAAEAEQRSLERQVQHAQKLESLGILAGGIAHDFNNILAVIVGRTELALSTIEEGARARDELQEVLLASDHAGRLVSQMLSHAGLQGLKTETVDLSELVRGIEELLVASVSKRARFTRELASELPAVQADPVQLRQVIMNLVVNASESLVEGKGSVTLRTGRLVEDQPSASSGGSRLFVEVMDDGSGMDADVQARVFDPFYSTKFQGRGLGMSAVLGIVRSHEGEIELHSTPGEGTRVRVVLPACESAASRGRTLAESGEPHGGGTVLVVDDDDGVRSVVERILVEMGYQVLTAADGAEGVEVFKTRQEDILAVVLDMTMPRMGGAEALAAIRAIDPAAIVILVSGHAEEEVSDSGGSLGADGFLQKPYSSASLAALLRSVLEQHDEASI